ncbi:MAG: uroporphyrinogen decarboxylase family protein [Planctomycetota bacterium]
MLSPVERVRKALRFEPQKNPPFTWGFGPNANCRRLLNDEFEAEYGLSFDALMRASEDVVWLASAYQDPSLPKDQAAYMAMWGIETKVVRSGLAVYDDEIARHPLAGISSTDELDSHPWPEMTYVDTSGMAKCRRELDPDGNHAVRISGGNPFEIYSWLVGLDNALVHMIAEPELFDYGLTKINAFFKARLTAEVEALGGEVDLVFIGDDVGSQHGPLLSPELYRERIQPFHRDLCSHIRSLLPNATTEYHSDGSARDLIPDLMDAGVQVLEAVQVECTGMEPESLAEAYGGRLGFQGGISVQQVLPVQSPDAVRTECRRLIDTLGAQGGYLAAPSHAIQAGTPAGNLLAMLEEVLGPERFNAAITSARLEPLCCQ